MNGFFLGTLVTVSFADSISFEREIDRVYDDGSFKLNGGCDRWYPEKQLARRISKDGVAVIAGTA